MSFLCETIQNAKIAVPKSDVITLTCFFWLTARPKTKILL